MPLTFGYTRVSTDGRALNAQLAQLEAGETPVSIAHSYNVHHATIGRL